MIISKSCITPEKERKKNKGIKKSGSSHLDEH